MIKPSVKAVLVENVLARQFAHLFPIAEAVQAHHTFRSGRIRTFCTETVLVGEDTVEVKLVGEEDESG